MSEKQLNAFIEKVLEDTSLKEKLKEANTPDEFFEIAKAAGVSITKEDLQSIQSEEVSDEELEKSAGGGTKAALTKIAVKHVFREFKISMW